MPREKSNTGLRLEERKPQTLGTWFTPKRKQKGYAELSVSRLFFPDYDQLYHPVPMKKSPEW